MATVLSKSLTERFGELQAERERSWPAERLQANASQRQNLIDRFDPQAVVQPGASFPNIKLADVEGGFFSVADVTVLAPAVFLFFRFAGCPACNIALKYYEETLYPDLRDRGISLVALSPQRPDLLRDIKTRQALSFTVASDPESALATYLGIAFMPDERPSPPPAGWIGEITGTDRWELPQPTVAIVDRDQTIRWLRVSPDWLDRPESEEILAALNAL